MEEIQSAFVSFSAPVSKTGRASLRYSSIYGLSQVATGRSSGRRLDLVLLAGRQIHHRPSICLNVVHMIADGGDEE